MSTGLVAELVHRQPDRYAVREDGAISDDTTALVEWLTLSDGARVLWCMACATWRCPHITAVVETRRQARL